ncbi:2-isopropylmalate synthase [Hydrogenispora ethanolica]|uniref:2-isopropylmalate synthase n=1 Tax=Hydrogenispora ethanolica TaxID=1082276 RepID=A0A4V6NGK5_HYDET|nr:2-isopropylmalate synthase [Hydrogenispora ethanolica]TCL55152.1 2-isopropylmalate synthase [Hydrogenispora ethanolica]
MMRQVQIFDTTLRDGEQSAGINLNVEEKLRVARQLARLNVDVIEAGFAIASPGDFEGVRAIAREVKGVTVCSLSRALKPDIDRAWEAVREAESPLIHTFIATSPIHMQYKLQKNPEQVLEMAVAAVRHARGLCPQVEFSAEDATRSEWDFLCRIFGAVIAAGATVINIPDTVGYIIPTEFGTMLRYIKEHTRGIEKVKLSVHCHNDLGLAVANSLAAVENGVDQVECTINGLGERAGNAALEEVVMALKTRAENFQAATRIHTEQLHRTSTLVSTLTGKPVQHNKAIVGSNAFAHEAGIHQDGILKNRMTYEIMTPESVGLSQTQLVLGKHSGRHAVKNRLEELGYTLSEPELDRAYEHFIELADKKKEVTDSDLEALVRNQVAMMKDRFELDYLHVSTGNSTIPTATVRLKADGALVEEAACGDGPIDAIYNAIDRITGIKVKLDEYSIKAVTSGQDALGESTVKVREDGHAYVGRGLSTDIIEASTLAYLHAVNKIAEKLKWAEVSNG